MGRLIFNEEGHEYLWDGKPVPSVTGILKAIGLSRDFSGIDSFFRDRGVATHAAIQLHLQGNLDQKSVDPVIVPYFEGALRYLDTVKSKPIAIEKPMYSEVYEYAGTIDAEWEEEIVDWKTSKSHDVVSQLQGEGYKILAGTPLKSFKVVALPGDGTFKVFEYGKGVDTWPSCIKIFQWWKKTHPRTKVQED